MGCNHDAYTVILMIPSGTRIERRVTGGTIYIGTVTIRARCMSASCVYPIMRLYINGIYIKQ
jgi:hypothetical protein